MKSAEIAVKLIEDALTTTDNGNLDLKKLEKISRELKLNKFQLISNFSDGDSVHIPILPQASTSIIGLAHPLDLILNK